MSWHNRRCTSLPCLLAVVATVLAGNAAAEEGVKSLPHVNDCSMCMKCHVDGEPPKKAIAAEDLMPDHFMPQDVSEKQKKPVCEECRGCTHQLTVLVSSGKKRIFGREFNDEGGASPNWLFLAPTSRTHSGKAIVKVACIPVSKHNSKVHPKCMAEPASRFAKLYLAIEMLAEDCGLQDIIPKVWVEHVNGVIPGVGYHIRWLGIWMEQAEGISLENLVRLGTPMMHPNELLNILHNKMNKSQVVAAAIFDLITSQCDRHAQNLFINEDGSVMLIDNERAFYENQWCALDSILLPTTKKFTINVMENAWVNKFKDWGDKEPQCWANAALLFDYRCYVEGGKLGKKWPPKVQRCLRKIKSMKATDLLLEYGFPNMHTAVALRNRSLAMLEEGFEYALTMGFPRNPNPWRYKFAPPCCKIKHTDTYRCAHEWKPDTAIPKGDPIGGGPWKREQPDPGTYEGGTVF
eukprot:CAMPEP_0202899652 /NCGR_PEP_ID=MMETSP1392-20130828/7827_1 /ASSEMBLY_ACC=CAM_ASM_000868 /TAXON_ID=225041 /ORGANISM="Chlamydomonas chlamydogama, Strain SAG 11-48b" /LENGTH=462 /DNA_ID=CAMNT_0049585895 /DNA_START=182 /DNA_END=1570 /DNA_ORIENTATION=-